MRGGPRGCALVLGLGFVLSGCLDPGANVLVTRDVAPPVPTAESVQPNAVVSRSAPLRVTFNEQMDPASLEAGLQLTLDGAPVPRSLHFPEAPPVPADLDPTNVPYPVEVTPDAALAGNTRYVLVLTTAIADLAGNPLANEIRIPFSTAP